MICLWFQGQNVLQGSDINQNQGWELVCVLEPDREYTDGLFCVGGPFHSHSEVQAAPPSTTAFFCKTETQHATQSCHINPSIKMSFYRLSLVCFIIFDWS